jgi:nucleoid DNA-binding protein
MALTKDRLVTRLQTQIGTTKPESRQIVERLFAIMKGTLSDGEDLLISGCGTFLVRQKKGEQLQETFAHGEGKELIGQDLMDQITAVMR